MPDIPASSQPPDKEVFIGELRQTLGDLERLLGEDDPRAAASAPVSARAALAAQAERSGMNAQGARPAPPPQPPAALPDEDSRALQLLTRFVAGALILAAEELVNRARRWEQQSPPEGRPAPGGSPLEEAGHLELARYWTLGALAYGRRAGVSALRATLHEPKEMVPSLLDMTDRATSIIFLRPLRGPMKSAIRQAQSTSRDWIVEGWREEQLSRWIAQNGVPEILDDIIAIISRNPELSELVSKQLRQQSTGVAASVIESGRRLSAVSDDLAENFARRLLRRGLRVEIPRIEPKSELPPHLALRTPPGENGGDEK